MKRFMDYVTVLMAPDDGDGSQNGGGGGNAGGQADQQNAQGQTGNAGDQGGGGKEGEGKQEEKPLAEQIAEAVAAEKAKWEADAKEKARLDGLKGEEKANAERDREKARAEKAERELVETRRALALAGKVTRPEAALKLLDESKHLNTDGSVNVAAFLKDNPEFTPKAVTDTGNGGAGGQQQKRNGEPQTLAEAIAMDKAAGRI